MTTRNQVKHTPGPWKVDDNGLVLTRPEVSGHEKTICDTGWALFANRQIFDRANECKANARLIASAPELLKACKLAVAHLEGGIQEFMRNAIAKAEEVQS